MLRLTIASRGAGAAVCAPSDARWDECTSQCRETWSRKSWDAMFGSCISSFWCLRCVAFMAVGGDTCATGRSRKSQGSSPAAAGLATSCSITCDRQIDLIENRVAAGRDQAIGGWRRWLTTCLAARCNGCSGWCRGRESQRGRIANSQTRGCRC